MATVPKSIRNKVTAYYFEVKKKYPVKKVILFGSHAYGKPGKDSDIDVVVVIDLPKKTDPEQIGIDLWHLTRKVDVTIEPKLVFYHEYKNPGKATILEYILKHGKVIAS